MSYPRPIVVVDIIGDIVNNVNTAILPKLQIADPTIVGLNYQYGPPLEINATLTQMSGTGQNNKYPLVALYQPFDEKKSLTGFDGSDPLRIIIARWSNATDKAADRYRKNFKPILYPIYAEFMYQLGNDKRIQSLGWEKIKHTKRDWPYWDDTGKNPLIDYVDIIEISNLELNFILKNC